jgi:hypothetical protein
MKGKKGDDGRGEGGGKEEGSGVTEGGRVMTGGMFGCWLKGAKGFQVDISVLSTIQMSRTMRCGREEGRRRRRKEEEKL